MLNELKLSRRSVRSTVQTVFGPQEPDSAHVLREPRSKSALRVSELPAASRMMMSPPPPSKEALRTAARCGGDEECAVGCVSSRLICFRTYPGCFPLWNLLKMQRGRGHATIPAAGQWREIPGTSIRPTDRTRQVSEAIILTHGRLHRPTQVPRLVKSARSPAIDFGTASHK
ncbi:hypothetical protein EYF80_037775 [Liparis tanakae]|uniref:Uncharacterized protein n=1 Tax=Liparis tanakae TaxID=230148 RepID=A0A4Z2GFJ6_9TELE|nr:hypothetical protein EYF80_037775 [Liparis tanakae]